MSYKTQMWTSSGPSFYLPQCTEGVALAYKWKQRELIKQGITGECSGREESRNKGPETEEKDGLENFREGWCGVAPGREGMWKRRVVRLG